MAKENPIDLLQRGRASSGAILPGWTVGVGEVDVAATDRRIWLHFLCQAAGADQHDAVLKVGRYHISSGKFYEFLRRVVPPDPMINNVAKTSL